MADRHETALRKAVHAIRQMETLDDLYFGAPAEIDRLSMSRAGMDMASEALNYASHDPQFPEQPLRDLMDLVQAWSLRVYANALN